MVQSNVLNVHASLLDSIRKAGGKPKKSNGVIISKKDDQGKDTSDNGASAKNPVMAELMKNLQARRKGITGKKTSTAPQADNNLEWAAKVLSDMIPPPSEDSTKSRNNSVGSNDEWSDDENDTPSKNPSGSEAGDNTHSSGNNVNEQQHAQESEAGSATGVVHASGPTARPRTVLPDHVNTRDGGNSSGDNVNQQKPGANQTVQEESKASPPTEVDGVEPSNFSVKERRKMFEQLG